MPTLPAGCNKGFLVLESQHQRVESKGNYDGNMTLRTLIRQQCPYRHLLEDFYRTFIVGHLLQRDRDNGGKGLVKRIVLVV